MSCGMSCPDDENKMVKQVTLAAAFHDHISCTKLPSSGHACGNNMNITIEDNGMNMEVRSPSVSHAHSHNISDHMYASESKSASSTCHENMNESINGVVNQFKYLSDDDQSQIQCLKDMLLMQLDLIQHQQEQLLKKDRQLQGLKQDREVLLSRLEKTEKRVAVLSSKLACSSGMLSGDSGKVTMIGDGNVIVSVDGKQLTQAEQESKNSGNNNKAGNVIGLFTDPTLFAKLCSQSTSSSTSSTSPSLSTQTITLTSSCVTQSSSQIKSGNQTLSQNITPNISMNTSNNTQTIRIIKKEPTQEKHCDNQNVLNVNVVSPNKKKKKRASEVSSLSLTSASTSSSPTLMNVKKKCKQVSTGTSTMADNAMNTDSISDSDLIKESISDNNSNSEISNVNSNFLVVKSGKKRDRTGQRKVQSTEVTQDSNSISTTSNKTSNSLNNKDILTTDKPFQVSLFCEPTSPPPVMVKKNRVNNKNNKKASNSNNNLECVEAIEVPTWRLHNVSSCYSMEGTENLDDEVFNRRHSKLEIDERRRKRWDIQRLREQRHNEKLRTGRYYAGSLGTDFIEKPSDLKKERKSCDITSFYPEAKDVEQIEVTDELPIIAFGHPIPKLPLKLFSLPWNISNIEKCSVTTSSSNINVNIKTSSTSTKNVSSKKCSH